MTDANKIKKFVDDLNWVNNILHSFAVRIAFIEITEEYRRKHQELEDINIVMNIYNSMANDAIMKINNIYDESKDVVSIYYLLNWVRGNTKLIKSHLHTLNLSFSESDIFLIEKKIKESSSLIKKFNTMRNKLIGHNDKKVVNATDIRRRLLNNKSINNKNAFLLESKIYIQEFQGFLLNKGDFIKTKDFTFSILMDIKQLLKMPDRIFGKSGNEKEWEDFYKFVKKDVSQFFDWVLFGTFEAKIRRSNK